MLYILQFCKCYNDLKHCKDKKGTEIYRLFQCSKCVSSKNKNIVFRTRNKNSAISIMKLTKEWIETQTRPSKFQLQTSFTRGTLTGLSKTISNEKVACRFYTTLIFNRCNEYQFGYI